MERKHTQETKSKISQSLKHYYKEIQTEEQKNNRIAKIKETFRKMYAEANGVA